MTYQDPSVNEAPPPPGGVKSGVLLGAGHTDVPHIFPGIVQLLVNRENPSMEGGHGILVVDRDLHFLGDK